MLMWLEHASHCGVVVKVGSIIWVFRMLQVRSLHVQFIFTIKIELAMSAWTNPGNNALNFHGKTR